MSESFADPVLPVTHLRPYLNRDSPALARLWNRGAASSAVARPLTVYEFDAHVLGGPHFDAAGLVVAEREGTVVGFSHAGFGPDHPPGRPLELTHTLGTVGMLIVDPQQTDASLPARLLSAAEDYLRARGASVLYAGGQYPLNPYYWGVYGGSEWSGILGGDVPFRSAVEARGYQPMSTTVLLEADLSQRESKDPKAVLIRRLTRVEMEEDALPPTWWHNLALSEFRPSLFRLVVRADGAEVARAWTWDMSWFGRLDNRSRLGLIGVEVDPEHRRKGYGRFLVQEIRKVAREQATSVLAVQTADTNTAALGLYATAGFEPVETATLYRLPG